MLTLRLARKKTATTLIAACAAVALAAPIAVANPSVDHKPAAAGGGKRVR